MCHFRRVRAAAAVLVAAVLLPIGAAEAQTAEEVVAKALQAKGGEQKLRSVNTVKITGHLKAQGQDIVVTTWTRRPNLMRREVQYGGRTVLSGFDGTTAWNLDPMVSSTPIGVAPNQTDKIKEEADFDGLLIDYKQKGRTIQLVGTETINGKNTHHLKIVKKTGEVVHEYVDAETGAELRTVQMGPKGELATEMSNYQNVDGISMPFTLTQTLNGRIVSQVTFDKVEFNLPIDDAFFRMPVPGK